MASGEASSATSLAVRSRSVVWGTGRTPKGGRNGRGTFPLPIMCRAGSIRPRPVYAAGGRTASMEGTPIPKLGFAWVTRAPTYLGRSRRLNRPCVIHPFAVAGTPATATPRHENDQGSPDRRNRRCRRPGRLALGGPEEPEGQSGLPVADPHAVEGRAQAKKGAATAPKPKEVAQTIVARLQKKGKGRARSVLQQMARLLGMDVSEKSTIK